MTEWAKIDGWRLEPSKLGLWAWYVADDGSGVILADYSEVNGLQYYPRDCVRGVNRCGSLTDLRDAVRWVKTGSHLL